MPQPMFSVPPAPSRRKALVLGMAGAMGAAAWSSTAHALPPRTLDFPRDHGSHPELRTEWWYITGYAQANGREWGFQVTFFRSRVDAAQGIQSAFAAKQLLFAHAALTDLKGQRLHHDQRIARAGFGVAQASESDTAIRLQDWSLVRSDLPGGGVSRYAARIQGEHFGLQLQFDATQPVLRQGREGLSRKGPESTQASYYYSQPQLAVNGQVQVKGQAFAVQGKAWLDHEWSDELLHPSAVGWDWLGMNLDDGSALTAFRLRDKRGGTVWAGGSFRRGDAPASAPQVFGHEDVRFAPLRHWTSPLTQTSYPVEWTVQTPAGDFTVRALLDNQELDSRSSTGSIYWEGLSELLDSTGRRVGSGYLEMTGYAGALRL